MITHQDIDALKRVKEHCESLATCENCPLNESICVRGRLEVEFWDFETIKLSKEKKQMAMSEFDKWWNRNQPVIEDGFQTPVMIHALRVAEMAYDAGVKKGKELTGQKPQQHDTDSDSGAICKWGMVRCERLNRGQWCDACLPRYWRTNHAFIT